MNARYFCRILFVNGSFSVCVVASELYFSLIEWELDWNRGYGSKSPVVIAIKTNRQWKFNAIQSIDSIELIPSFQFEYETIVEI